VLAVNDKSVGAKLTCGRGDSDRIFARCASGAMPKFAASVARNMSGDDGPGMIFMTTRAAWTCRRGAELGTDELGRDMLARPIHGGRLSWFVGITPVMMATIVGASLGLTAGYTGRLNMLIMRSTDVCYAFPSVLLAVAISGALGPGIANAIMALTIAFKPESRPVVVDGL
jgi:ABC-type dipeptide/oligopeptide/nickel transport system permease subunit